MHLVIDVNLENHRISPAKSDTEPVAQLNYRQFDHKLSPFERDTRLLLGGCCTFRCNLCHIGEGESPNPYSA